MSRHSNRLFKAALSALHYSGADGLLAPFTAGNGVIFMLHQVTPEAPRAFEPNRILKVTPEFLDDVVRQVRDLGFDFISLDAVPERLSAPVSDRPFAVFTLDDGYKDNRDFAYPVFKRHGVPFTVYVPTDFADGRGDLWWLSLEEAIRRLPAITLNMEGQRRYFTLATTAEKDATFEEIYWWLRTLPEIRARAITHNLARQAAFDPFSFCRDLVMGWAELRDFAADPLVTIVGSGPDTEALKARVAALGLSNVITFTGALPAREAFNRGRVMAVPSLAESFPYVVLEAAAAGLPLISTNVGGIPEIVAETDTDLIEPANVAALSAALRDTLANPGIAAAKAKRLRDNVQRKFTVAGMTASIVDFYASTSR